MEIHPPTSPRRLTATDLSVRLSGEARATVRHLDFELAPGEVAGVTGRSGAGKSTLLHLICGLVPWLRRGVISGEIVLGGEPIIDLDPGQRAHLLATCLDRPDSQLFLATVDHELRAASALYGNEMSPKRLATAFGVKALMDRRITELSSGERQRVALACTFAAAGRPILLDEPTAHLDSDGVALLNSALSDLPGRGGSCLLTEQAGWRLSASVDRWSRLARGALDECPEPRRPEFPEPPKAGGQVVLACDGLKVERGGEVLVDGADLEIQQGEVILLSGPNGSGKSTLARVLAGVRPPGAGNVNRRGRSALMLPTAELQLFGRTVAEEVGRARAGRVESAKVLRRHRLEHLAARAPWTLSRGERQRLVHAALDLLRPSLMIVDEPAQGLDPEDLAAFVELVHRRAEKGRAYLIISHRSGLARAVHRRWLVRDRTVVEVVR